LVAAVLVIFLRFLSLSSITHNFEPDMKRKTLISARLLRLEREYTSMKGDASERFEARDKKVSDSLDVARLRTLESEYTSLKRDAEALDKRVSDLSDSGRSMKRDALKRFETLDKRVSDSPDAARPLILKSKHKSLKRDAEALACPQNLNDFTTIKHMQEAGWDTSGVSEMIVDGRFTGWKGGREAGSIKLHFNVSGRMILHFGNPFWEVDPENVVTVKLNQQLVASAERRQDTRACFIFQKDDVLTLAERYAQIEIASLKVSCFPEKGQVKCGVGRAVQVRPLQCDANDGQAGVIQEIVNMNTALVKISAPTANHTGYIGIDNTFAAQDLYVQPQKGEVLPTVSLTESADGLPPVLRCDSFIASKQ